MRKRKLERKVATSRPFSRDTDKRVLILSLDERIPLSQVHPFQTYGDEFLLRFGAEVRETIIDGGLNPDHPNLRSATTICFQSRFDIGHRQLLDLVSRVRDRNPEARLVYLDWFAPTDLRFAEVLDSHVSVYVKKHVFSDTARYGRPTLGDTNLTDHFSRRFDLDMPETRFPVPEGFLSKLLIGPSFVTADYMEQVFRRGGSLGDSERPIDLHARIAVNGTDWYQAMRTECAEAVRRLNGVNSVVEPGVGLAAYLREMHSSKICFSPFGYGEVCWRDFEAVACGAALLKPDMSHVRTDPDIFVAGETYLPVRWDLADFPEKVDLLLRDEDLRRHLTGNAFAKLNDYVASGRFVDQMAPVFS